MSWEVISNDGTFSQVERNVIAAIADATIPGDDALSLPGAGEPLILSMILHKAEHFEGRVKPGIEALVAEVDPLSMVPGELVSLLDQDPRFNTFYRVLIIAIIQAYYQDSRVLTALGLEARPPFPLGHELESGDWSLLDPVKKRPPLYRPV